MRNYPLLVLFAVLLGASCNALDESTSEVEVRATARVGSSSIKPGKVIHKVYPVYPPLAVTDRIAGTVLLEAIVGKDGSIKELCVKRGHPKLVGATVEAVWQWKYEPTLLNGQPYEVQVGITVDFKLKDEEGS